MIDLVISITDRVLYIYIYIKGWLAIPLVSINSRAISNSTSMFF